MRNSRVRALLGVLAALAGLLAIPVATAISNPGGDGDPNSCDRHAVVSSYLESQRFDMTTVNVGESNFQDGLTPRPPGRGAFSQEQLLTRDSFIPWVNESTSQEATTVRENHALHLLGRYAPNGDLDNPTMVEAARLYQGDGWVGAQFTGDINAPGNTRHGDGIQPAGAGSLAFGAGEVFWYYVGPDCEVLPELIVRGSCGNPQLIPPTPRNPRPTPTTSTPPGTTPTTRPPRVTTTTSTPPTTQRPGCPPGEDFRNNRCIKVETPEEEQQQRPATPPPTTAAPTQGAPTQQPQPQCRAGQSRVNGGPCRDNPDPYQDQDPQRPAPRPIEDPDETPHPEVEGDEPQGSPHDGKPGSS